MSEYNDALSPGAPLVHARHADVDLLKLVDGVVEVGVVGGVDGRISRSGSLDVVDEGLRLTGW